MQRILRRSETVAEWKIRKEKERKKNVTFKRKSMLKSTTNSYGLNCCAVWCCVHAADRINIGIHKMHFHFVRCVHSMERAREWRDQKEKENKDEMNKKRKVIIFFCFPLGCEPEFSANAVCTRSSARARARVCAYVFGCVYTKCENLSR